MHVIKNIVKIVINKIKKDFLFAMLIPIIIIIVVSMYYYIKFSKADFIRNSEITTCIVTDYKIGSGKSAGISLYYYYYVEGIKYIGYYTNISIYHSHGHAFINKSFPLIYDTRNPKDANLLLTKRDFSNLKQPFPDSLEWVKEYISPEIRKKYYGD